MAEKSASTENMVSAVLFAWEVTSISIFWQVPLNVKYSKDASCFFSKVVWALEVFGGLVWFKVFVGVGGGLMVVASTAAGSGALEHKAHPRIEVAYRSRSLIHICCGDLSSGKKFRKGCV